MENTQAGHGPSKTVGTIVWLEDDPRDPRMLARSEELSAAGFKIVKARGFRELDKVLRERANYKKDVNQQDFVSIIILDIMIEGVEHLSRFFRWVKDARTSRGYAAGLVFLERIFAPAQRSAEDTLFGAFEAIPVVLYSIREISDVEMDRIEKIRQRRSAPIKVLVKASDDELVRTIEQLIQP